MIIVRLKGGLGNQMFEYALGRVLSLKNNTELLLDLSFLKRNLPNITKRSFDLDVFNIKAKIADTSEIPFYFKFPPNNTFRKLAETLRKTFHIRGQERGFSFDPSVLSLSGDVCLDGYWQSPKYFGGFEEVIRNDFTLKNEPAQNIKALADEISKTNSLCIHVRRGDYVANAFHEVVNNEYYQRGIQYIKGKSPIERIYVFSDDIGWCKDNLTFEFPVVFVEESYAGEKGEGHMYLMSLCQNFIIANSSFSWWAAWLSTRENKIVICPQQWFADPVMDSSDLIPREWVRI